MNGTRRSRSIKRKASAWRWLFGMELVITVGILAFIGVLAISAEPSSAANLPVAQTLPCTTPSPTSTPTPSPSPSPSPSPTATPLSPSIIAGSKPRVANAAAAAATPCPTAKPDSTIAGTIFVDGNPASGFTVKLDASNFSQTTGADGKYKFTGLGAGGYTVRVVYDNSKFAPLTTDFSLQTVSNNSDNENINFQFKSLTTATPTPTKAAPASFNPTLQINPASGPAGTKVTITGTGWNPKGPDGGTNQVTVILDNTTASGQISGFSLANAPVATLGTFPVGTDGSVNGIGTLPDLAPQTFKVLGTDLNKQSALQQFQVVGQANICSPAPAVPDKLRVTLSSATIAGNGKFQLCVSLTAPSNDGVNLNDTVIVNLPNGASASQLSVSTGTVSVTGSTVRWGGFSLAPQQNATLTLNVDTTNGTLDGTSVFVSGRFNRGLAFQQRINGLPALTEIDATAPVGNNNVVVPQSAPSTGNGYTAPDNTLPTLVFVLIGAWVITLGLWVGKRFFWRKQG